MKVNKRAEAAKRNLDEKPIGEEIEEITTVPGEGEEMTSELMRVILPSSPELAEIQIGDEVMLSARKVSESGGKISLDIIKVENGAAPEEGMPSVNDITTMLGNPNGPAGVPAPTPAPIG